MNYEVTSVGVINHYVQDEIRAEDTVWATDRPFFTRTLLWMKDVDINSVVLLIHIAAIGKDLDYYVLCFCTSVMLKITSA